MKKALLILAMGSMTLGYSQVTDNDRNHRDHGDQTHMMHGNQKYTLTPDGYGYVVSREMNGSTTTYGKLRRANADDDYFIMQSSDRGTVMFGKFDDNGNFNAYRYDPIQDEVVEINYKMHSGHRINPDDAMEPKRATNIKHAYEDQQERNPRNKINPETDRRDTNKSNMNNHMGTNP